MDLAAAIEAIVADDRTGLANLLDAQPGLVRQAVTDERFVEAIVHQFLCRRYAFACGGGGLSYRDRRTADRAGR
ncbi:MAG: hypothetical protein WDN06_20835 [Asticcacaulis sp.]